MRKAYRTDLTDAQWQLIEPLLPAAKHGGRPRTVDLREVVNTLFYQVRTGCQWDYLPHDLVPKGTAWDYGANLFALWGISTPNFWLGIMLIFLFSIKLGWLPASGYVPLSQNWRESLASTILPAFVLGNAIAAVLMRHTRSAMLQVLESDYVRTARAKGLSERSVILKHAMRNALTPVITLAALELGTLLSGAVLTEQIFSIPGFGKLIVDAVFNRDYAVVQGVVLVTATIYIALNLLADIAYILVNPRLRG